MEFFDNNSAKAPEQGIVIHDFWLLALRLLITFTLIYFQGWQQIVAAWRYVWSKAPFTLVEQLETAGVPSPNVLAPLFAALLIVVCLALAFGFLTRIFALVGLLLFLFVLVANVQLSDTLNVQALVLHCGLLLIMTFAGGGRFSLGTLLSRKVETT